MASSVRLREAGASAMEYIGATIVAALVAGGLFVTTMPEQATSAFRSAGCAILHQGCEAPGGTTPGEDGLTPYERATRGKVAFLGDSYASGEGAGDYIPGTDVTGWNWLNPLTWTPSNWGKDRNMCHQSNNSYQAQVFRTLQGKGAFPGQDYATAACSGATVQDLYNNDHQGNAGVGPQAQTNPTDDPKKSGPFDKIPPDASLISLSLGGNDVGFADVLTNCLVSFMGSGCGDTNSIVAQMDRVYGKDPKDGKPGMTGELEAQLAKMKAEHPDARIIIMGYPQLFAETEPGQWIQTLDGPIYVPYPNGPGLSVKDQKWANSMSIEINAHIKAMCDRLGVEFVDPTSAFVGNGYDHRIGSSDPWLNGLNFGSPSGDLTLDKGSFHPNHSGHDAMAGLLLQQIEEGPR